MIQDYKCTYDNASGVNREVTSLTGLTFPDAYLHADTMVKLAETIKEYHHLPLVEMPFCHTVEAEALGGIINLGDDNAGPRVKDYITKDPADLLKLPHMDFSGGRIRETLLACEELEKRGHRVAMEICGPFTIMNALMDPRYIFKGMRKDPELMKQVFARIGEEIFRYMEEAKKYHVSMISYADAVGGVNILGPVMAEQVVEMFTYEFVKKIRELSDEHTLMMLCPKTTFALVGTGHAEFKDVPIPGTMTYGEACIESIGKIKLAGQTCMKNTGFVLNGTIKEVIIK